MCIRDRIEKEYAEGKMQEKKPRILITGCPIGGATEKVIRAVEDNGGIVVTYENCSGAKSIDKLVDENNPDVYDAIARRYLNIGCSVMTPTPNRFEMLGRLIDEYQVDGVVEDVYKRQQLSRDIFRTFCRRTLLKIVRKNPVDMNLLQRYRNGHL